MKKLPLLLAGLWFASQALANPTPVGVWKTIDDDKKIEKSLVRITESGGVLTGTVEKYLDPTIPQGATCEKCTDDRKHQPILGMTIIRGVRKDPDAERWDGGHVLDPANGKSYKVRLTLVDGGRKLEVRGYVGTPMFGRTQTWLRAQ